MIRALLAIFLPFMVFFTIGKPIQGIICLILQVTLLGWIPAMIWAFYALADYKNERRHRQYREALWTGRL